MTKIHHNLVINIMATWFLIHTIYEMLLVTMSQHTASKYTIGSIANTVSM